MKDNWVYNWDLENWINLDYVTVIEITFEDGFYCVKAYLHDEKEYNLLLSDNHKDCEEFMRKFMESRRICN